MENTQYALIPSNKKASNGSLTNSYYDFECNVMRMNSLAPLCSLNEPNPVIIESIISRLLFSTAISFLPQVVVPEESVFRVFKVFKVLEMRLKSWESFSPFFKTLFFFTPLEFFFYFFSIEEVMIVLWSGNRRQVEKELIILYVQLYQLPLETQSFGNT